MQPHSHYRSGMGALTGGSSSCINKPTLTSLLPHRCGSLPVSVFIDLLCWRMMAPRDHRRDINRERQGIMARQEIKPVSIGIFGTFQKLNFSMIKFWTWCSSWRVQRCLEVSVLTSLYVTRMPDDSALDWSLRLSYEMCPAWQCPVISFTCHLHDPGTTQVFLMGLWLLSIILLIVLMENWVGF